MDLAAVSAALMVSLASDNFLAGAKFPPASLRAQRKLCEPCARSEAEALLAGDHLFDSRQRVPVGGQESQHVPAGYAAPVVDPVITGLFSDRSGVTPRVLTAPSLKCTQHQRKGDHQSSVVAALVACQEHGTSVS